MKKKGTKQKSKTTGSENAFGCDLTEHLQNSGQDVPQVLQKCAEFIEKHGIVHGIYRLSGVTSNIQRLRQEFSAEACPDLTKEVYLQDIHCVGSLCKLYFRELPNPLLTYELYSKFTEVASVCGDHERLVHVQKTVKELPTPHFRTLEYLSKHLARLATLSAQTNMHTRNLALVWAPNLLRSKTIEAACGNGDMAFQEVRIQQSVVEFILNHTEQIFNSDPEQMKSKEGSGFMCGEKYATLPISSQCGQMKLMSLEEAQARSLSPNHPLHKERQRENSLPDTSTATLYHTVIELDSKRKLTGKSKKWRSIFNLGRSVDSKGKLSRNGSVFIRAPGLTEKASLRPSRSMESLCSLPTDDDRTGKSPSGGQSSIFVPGVKSRTLGSDSLYDLSEDEQNWELKGKKSGGTTSGWKSGLSQKGSLSGASATPQRTLPEQLKVFKGDELSGNKPTSPKNRRMLYSGSSSTSSSRPSFPGSFFPLESSPRHQRRAVNISEPFAVSVPLRVSAVISSNSTPCRGLAKDWMTAATLKPCKETSNQSDGGKSNTGPIVEPDNRDGTEKKQTERVSNAIPKGKTREFLQDETVRLEELSIVNEGTSEIFFSGQQLENKPIPAQQNKESTSITKQLLYDVHQQLKITKPDLDILDKNCDAILPCQNKRLTRDVKSKRSRSSPSLSIFCKDQSSNSYLNDHLNISRSEYTVKQPSESDILFSLYKSDVWVKESRNTVKSVLEETDMKQPISQKIPSSSKAHTEQHQVTLTSDSQIVGGSSAAGASPGQSKEHKRPEKDQNQIPEDLSRFSKCLEERPTSLDLPIQEDDDGLAGNAEELDLVESWEDLSASKQWVTSPLHSPDVEELFKQQLSFGSQALILNSDEDRISFSSCASKQSKRLALAKTSTANIPQTSKSKYETKLSQLPSTPASLNTGNGTQAPTGKSGTKKLKTLQHFYRQMSHESALPEKREERHLTKHRPYSLNLDLGPRYIRDISNQQIRPSAKFSSYTRSLSETVNNGLLSELDLFLNDSQASLRRNSAPVSVSSVRTAFMIKTCKAKAVPVVPPKVQYSQIPHSRQGSDTDTEKEDTECPQATPEKTHAGPPSGKEELENKEPAAQQQSQPKVQKQADNVTASATEAPVITRRHAPSLEVFVDCPRPNKGNILQRSSFRNRQRPQSLILFSPPFPIMDYPPVVDDGKLLSIQSVHEQSAVKEPSGEGVALQNKMTIPKTGQRLETSTSCFYQPQRRSMIFESRNQRQIE